MKSEADADDEQREHAEDGPFLPAHVVFLLDELGHGQLVRKLEDEIAPRFAREARVDALVPHVQNGVKKHVRHESIDTSHTSDLSPRRESMCSTCLGSCQGVTSLVTDIRRQVLT